MTEREAILEWLAKTFPGCTFEFWQLGKFAGIPLAAEWFVTIARPPL